MWMLLLSLMVFFMARLSPGDPVKSYYGEGAERLNKEERQEAIQYLGLDKPIIVQYKVWLQGALKGDLGISFKYKQDVITVINDMYQNTLILGGISYILTFLFALLLGIFCVMREETWVDKVICKVGTVTNSIPAFWLSLVGILLFSVNLKLLPSSGAYNIGMKADVGSRIEHLILPVFVMVVGHLWYYAYMVRNKLLEEIRKDYVLLAKAKGLTKRQIIYRHCLPNILPFFLGLMAMSIPHIIAGTYVVEKVFSYPGLGTLCFESAKYHDYNLLMVLTLITGLVVMISNMAAQVISEKIDQQMEQIKGGMLS